LITREMLDHARCLITREAVVGTTLVWRAH
jgi:hypothetical protein